MILLVSAVGFFYARQPAAMVFSPLVQMDGPVLIIDPGHGGADGGAVSDSGTIESAINLEIALKLEQILGLFGVNFVLTRTTETIDYPESAETLREKKVYDQHQRVELVNSYSQAVLISIHQNKYTTSSPSGAQVFYAPTNGSMELAVSMEGVLSNVLQPENVRSTTQIADSIYLMNSIRCPAILIECGFLSNPAEAELLTTDAYQTKLAAGIASGYFVHYIALQASYFGGSYEV